MTHRSAVFLVLSALLFFQDGQALSVKCGATNFSLTVDECASPTQHSVLFGNCTNGIWEEDSFVDDCPEASPYCHECGTTRVICSKLDNAADACNEFPSTLSSKENCASIGNGFATQDQCTSPTQWASEFLECENGTTASRDIQRGSCSESNPSQKSCLDCGTMGFCHAGDPATTTCASFGVAESHTDSVTCNNEVNHAFTSDSCISATQYAVRYGNCTNGILEEEYVIVDCFEDSPYCHDCSANRVVCSQSSDVQVACQEFPNAIPSRTDCSTVPTGFLSQAQCSSSTSYTYEYLDCEGGSVFDLILGEGVSCSSDDPNLNYCLDCGAVGYCHGGDPATTTCDTLGLGVSPVPTLPQTQLLRQTRRRP